MTTKDDGGPAFPAPTAVDSWLVGMTLSDYFAAKALPALLQNALDNEITFDGFDSFDGMIAEQAYALADAMLAQRSAS